MNYTQNEKIEQVKESTLVLGVDIGSIVVQLSRQKSKTFIMN